MTVINMDMCWVHAFRTCGVVVVEKKIVHSLTRADQTEIAGYIDR